MTESKKVREKRLKKERDVRNTAKFTRDGLMSKSVLIPTHLSDKYSEMGAIDVQEHRNKLKNKSYRKKLGLPDPDPDPDPDQ